MINMSAKFDKETRNGVVYIVFTSLFPYMSIVTLTFDLWPQKSHRVHPLIMINMSAKFDKETRNGVVSIVFTRSTPYRRTEPQQRYYIPTATHYPLTMCNMSAKFDKQIQNGLVSIVFTSLFPYMSIVTLTFDLWPPKSIGFILSSWLTCLPSFTKKHTTV